MPGPVRYNLKISFRGGKKLNVYSYQWGASSLSSQQPYEGDHLPSYDGHTQQLHISWDTKSTDADIALINRGALNITGFNGETDIGSYYHSGLATEITKYIHTRGDGTIQIMHRGIAKITGLLGINLLQTCKQFEEEASRVLYGENEFLFDSRGHYPFTHHRGVHDHDALANSRRLIPGLVDENGVAPTADQVRRAICGMFHKADHVFQPAFLKRNPMTNFFHKIGRKTASRSPAFN